MFNYLGLPTKFLPKPPPIMEQCGSCHEGERCALVQTRAMKSIGRARDSFSKLSNSIRKFTLVRLGKNMLDLYQPSICLTLSKQVYDRWRAKFFQIEKLFRAAFILTALEMYKLRWWAPMEEMRKDRGQ